MSFADKSTQEVIGVIQAVNGNLNDRTKSKIVITIRDSPWTGNDLCGQSTDDLREMGFGFASNKLFNLIEKGANAAQSNQQSIQEALNDVNKLKQQRPVAQNNNICTACGSHGNASNHCNIDRFRVKYKYNGRSMKTRNTFTQESKVCDFVNILASNEVGGIEAEKTTVIYLSNRWTTGVRKTFGSFSFDERIEVIVSHRVVGGATMSMEEKTKVNISKSETRARFPDFENKSIEATFAQDDLMFVKDKQLRVRMPCGHVFGAQTVYEIVNMCAQDNGKLKVECPMLDCGKEWNFVVLMAAADLNNSEIGRFNNIFTNRGIANSADTRICKGCKNVIERGDNLLYTRVHCIGQNCPLKSDFCWICGETWKGGGMTVCGNKGCVMERINDILQNCESKILVKESANYTKKCPIFRACPMCATLVEYDTSCKHMKCWGCQKKFCFYCLGVQNSKGIWPCISYSYQCQPAPRQRFK